MLPRKDGSLVNWRAIEFYEFANPDPNAGFRDVIAELCRVARAAEFGILLYERCALRNDDYRHMRVQHLPTGR